MQVFNSYQEMAAANAGQTSGSQMSVFNKPHLNFGKGGGIVDFCVERYDQAGNDYPGNDSEPIASTEEKERLTDVQEGAPFYAVVTTGHDKLPSGNVVVYDGNGKNVVRVGNWDDKEIRKALQVAAKKGNGSVPALPAKWETKLFID